MSAHPSTELSRSDRRRLRKAILAEARRLAASEDNWGCRYFTVDLETGAVVRREPRYELRKFSDLLHLCALLDGRVSATGGTS